ncbi:hypothetical protein POM88_044852 [Heracleum sosnowskyi]|uniref:RNase H type-1 domain-containing protein n=1 Tax=Heracleum sosnowskyi TaxID=360622 RepID=A0AAD8M5R9_9APIA|nr:hypothetical protein POM88_044852 [Heracleum sosnowskyi]
MLLWSVWKARNMVVWHDTYLHVEEVVRTTHFTLDQWLEAQAKKFVPFVGGLHVMDDKELWTKPEWQTIKINVDAALFSDENRFGYGFIARDHTDCIKVVQSLRSSVSLASPFGLVISDCKQLMQEIAHAAFYVVKRSANRVAHCLARQSIFLSDCNFTEANAPLEKPFSAQVHLSYPLNSTSTPKGPLRNKATVLPLSAGGDVVLGGLHKSFPCGSSSLTKGNFFLGIFFTGPLDGGFFLASLALGSFSTGDS